MDPRRELELINKHVHRRNREAGEAVIWYQFSPLNTGASTYDDVYDEGAPGVGGKNYVRGITLPTIYIEEVEDSYRAIEDGRKPTQNVRLTVLFRDMLNAGIEDPREYKDHLNDVFEYDSRYYKIQDYRVRGRLHRSSPSGEAIVVVVGYEVFIDEEMPFSFGPRNPAIQDLPWPNTFPS